MNFILFLLFCAIVVVGIILGCINTILKRTFHIIVDVGVIIIAAAVLIHMLSWWI